MRTLAAVFVLAALALAGTAAAEPASCTITRIKDQAVSLAVPIDAKVGPELFCQTHAQSTAKKYAVEHVVCEKHNAREATFSVTVVYRAGKTERTYEVKAFCPPAPARK